MPPRRAPILGLVVALVIAACSSATPGWTYAPAPSLTPAPSGAASVEPSDGGASAAPSGQTAGGVQISAVNVQFEQSEVAAPADTAFQIVFANNDAGVPHNVEIKDEGGASVFTGEIFNGVETRTYDVPAIPAGGYTFICTVHPNMTGTLTAG